MVGKQLSALRIEADSSRTTIYNRFEELNAWDVAEEWWSMQYYLCRNWSAWWQIKSKNNKNFHFFIFQLKDASRSVARTIQNNLMDGSKQEAIDLFLYGSALSTQIFHSALSILPAGTLFGELFDKKTWIFVKFSPISIHRYE